MKQKHCPELPDTIGEILACNNAATFIISTVGDIIECNSYALNMFGYKSVDDMRKVKVVDLTPKDFQDYFPDEISEEHLTDCQFFTKGKYA